jgi:hypothetical protein
MPTRQRYRGEGPQTTSKFPFRWWGVNSTLSGRHQLNGQPEPHSTEGEALDASESRDGNSVGYADSTRSASFPTGVNKIMTLLGKSKTHGKTGLQMTFEGQRNRVHSPREAHSDGVGNLLPRLHHQSQS